MRNNALRQMVISAMLCGIGFAIPIYSPIKIIIEPASFTLGAHVAIFIGAFISPAVAAAVALGTTLGFVLSGLPHIIALRAATHVIFAVLAALLLKKWPRILKSPALTGAFSLGIGIIHAVCEVTAVTLFYIITGGAPAQGYARSVLLLLGVGTVIHSIVDFGIALVVWKALMLASRSERIRANA